ncbi:MAG TPA: GNAT family N-acetyltransferase [Thermoanaerobaculia bacterium]|nr:GNAT family N-acetyltransferase [Thermoanaerobaculia bacterium]
MIHESEITIREVTPDDIEYVHRLNEEAVPNMNSLGIEEVRWFVEAAAWFRLPVVDGQPAGFLIALDPRTAYRSMNFLWFKARYPSFIYIDRVVVAKHARQRGIGRRLYEELQVWTRGRSPRITCEVNLDPPNPGSLAFHHALGFREVGRQHTEGGSKLVSLMTLELA